MPSDYISRETVISDIEQTIENSGCVNHEREIIDCVRYADAADVVPVVRCGECIHRVNMVDNKEICCGRMAMRVMALDDYCSNGVCMERRQPEGGSQMSESVDYSPLMDYQFGSHPTEKQIELATVRLSELMLEEDGVSHKSTLDALAAQVIVKVLRFSGKKEAKPNE